MTWNNVTKNVSSFVKAIKQKLVGFLLQENGAYLLLETGGRIIIEDDRWGNSGKNSSTYSNAEKNSSNYQNSLKQNSNWNNEIKNG